MRGLEILFFSHLTSDAITLLQIQIIQCCERAPQRITCAMCGVAEQLETHTRAV